MVVVVSRLQTLKRKRVYYYHYCLSQRLGAQCPISSGCSLSFEEAH